MNLKRSPFAIQDKNSRDLDNVKDYSTLKELDNEKGIKILTRKKPLFLLGCPLKLSLSSI